MIGKVALGGVLVILWGGIVGNRTALAQDAQDLTGLSLDDLLEAEVAYAASRRIQSLREAPSAVSVVTAAEIREHGYRTLADVLRSLPSFYVTEDRHYSYVGVRGFNRPGDYGARILLLLNGLRTNDNLYEQAYVGHEFLVDIDLVERIEVVRGPSAAIYGSSAFFGVVNVVTRHGGDFQGGELTASASSYATAFGRKQTLAPKVLDLSALVVEFTRMLPPVLGEDIELVIVADPSLGLVKADPGQLEQILMNLSVNARDAMPEGGRITISTSNVTRENRSPTEDDEGAAGGAAGSFVMLTVSDTGCGMSDETLPLVFEPFFTTKAQGQGTGLGLSTVYGIMKQSGGQVEIDSAPGRGTTFRLYFPRVDEPIEDGPSPSAQSERHGTETILLVEDEEALRELVADMLRERGYTVLEADCGRAALEMSDRHPGVIDLLLTDVVMPGMGGRQAAREVALRRPAIRVVFMSAHSDDALGARGILDPGTTLLQKPFTGDALDRCLALVFARPEAAIARS